ncbi:MAG: glycosyltransferase [Planctomycetes bacterium]|nr:glycosyltransferase [Planctomycetota bacterium]
MSVRALARLTLCVLARDEERALGGCLDSARGLADEVVVGDTGSSDGTVALARARGARVEAILWTDHFAEARNALLAHARGEWVLVLDADERLDGADHSVVRAALAPTHDAWWMVCRNYVRDASACAPEELRPAPDAHPEASGAVGWYPSTAYRLWRRAAALRFAGRLHEMLDVSALPPSRVGFLAAPIHHLGTLEGASTRKRAYYLRLGRIRTGEEPHDERAWYDLALAQAREGVPREAAASLERAFSLAPDHPQILLERVRFAVDACARSPGDPALLGEARTRVAVARGRLPRDRQGEGALLEARLEGAHGDATRALGIVRALPEGIGFARHHLEGVLLCRLGRCAEALAPLDRALSLVPGHADARHHRAYALMQTGNAAAAGREWEALMATVRPDSPAREAVVRSLAAARLALGDADGALSALAAGPATPAVAKDRSRVLLRCGRTREALEALSGHASDAETEALRDLARRGRG